MGRYEQGEDCESPEVSRSLSCPRNSIGLLLFRVSSGWMCPFFYPLSFISVDRFVGRIGFFFFFSTSFSVLFFFFCSSIFRSQSSSFFFFCVYRSFLFVLSSVRLRGVTHHGVFFFLCVCV